MDNLDGIDDSGEEEIAFGEDMEDGVGANLGAGVEVLDIPVLILGLEDILAFMVKKIYIYTFFDIYFHLMI